MDAYETYLLKSYIARALDVDSKGGAKRPSRAVAGWLYDNAERLGWREPKLARDVLDPDLGRIDAESWARFSPILKSLATPSSPPRASDLERRMRWLCKTLKLSALETDILRALVRAKMDRPFRTLMDVIDYGHGEEIKAPGLATLTGYDQRLVGAALKLGQPLRLFRLADRECCGFVAQSMVMRIAGMEGADSRRLRAALVGSGRKPQLAWEDFAHIGESAELVERVLAGAIEKRSVGVNILLHGAPGTGKTEFVHTLAKRLEADVLFVGETDDDGEEPDRKDRIAAFAIARSLAAVAGRAIIVVDEADDIFTSVDHSQAFSRVGSKVFMNRLVERTEAPTIWITNHEDQLGAAVLRRMSLAIRFPEPGRSVRRRVVERISKRRALRLDESALERLADLRAAPALIDSAIRVAKLTGGGSDDIEHAARSVVRAMRGGAPPPALAGPTPFDPSLSAADHDLADLADRVAASGELAISFCLHGVPGAGKSAYGRYLAERMGLDVIEKRASDLLNMYVGESEKEIARAFQNAMDRRAMLIIDEADSLLRDRAGAQRSWEVTQVNEMLSWMERHPYPFVCTTNLMDSLDPATLRRFVFKVKFLPMTRFQARTAFARSFGVEAPRALDGLDNLAPGDFAVVARKAKVLCERDPVRLADLLTEEVAAKTGGQRRKIGF
jgi:SpoVK/Ycf46/Vps4 family AAA+-type ATPase